MERMTPKDAAILELENDVSAAHGLTIGIFDGPQPNYDEILERIEDRIRLVPRYRQRLLNVPFGLERPVWVDDPNFSIDFHVRNTALPKRTGRDPFNAFISRCLSQRLDRGKPLWEVWIVSGLPKKQWAIVSKVHYTIVDGVSGADVLGLLADDIEVHASIGKGMPQPLPGPRSLLVDAVGDLVFDPLESFRMARGVVNAPLRTMQKLTAGAGRAASPDALSRSAGPHRKWQSAIVPLEDLRTARTKHGCSTTDVILAAVGGGIRNYLVAAGRPLPQMITVLVPLAVGAASAGISGQVTTLTAELPIAEEDPIVRLGVIHAQTSSGAARTGATAGRTLRRQENFVAPSILAQGVRSTMLETRSNGTVDTVAINVPGPEQTIEVLGKQMVETYPVIPLPGGVQIAMAAMSLRDDVYFGITADYDTVQGLRHASAGVVAEVNALR
jgi:WS/DGAT/MGAT family acyltransferase